MKPIVGLSAGVVCLLTAPFLVRGEEIVSPLNSGKSSFAAAGFRPFSRFFDTMIKPVVYSPGGLLRPNCCRTSCHPCISPAEAAAARVKSDFAGAKARRGAIRYLAGVDCKYYPEAECALIQGLREDPVECVRLEAAMALGRSCYCSKQTVVALTIAASGTGEDGNPPESSPRVRQAALWALNHCLQSMAMWEETEEIAPPKKLPPPTRPEYPPEPQTRRNDSRIQLTGYYQRVLPKVPSHLLMQQAARLLAENVGNQSSPKEETSRPGLFQIWRFSNHKHEPIPFDEAALGKMEYPKRMEMETKDSGRASLSFSPNQPEKKKENPISPASFTQEGQPPQEKNQTPQPVPWPLDENGQLIDRNENRGREHNTAAVPRPILPSRNVSSSLNQAK